MKVLDINGNIITNYDLSKGKLIIRKMLREDVAPIDNITKFTWTDEDFEEVQIYVPNKEKTAKEQINELKKQLEATDYKVIKCSECQLVGIEMPYNIAELHVERQAIRDKINRLEQESL